LRDRDRGAAVAPCGQNGGRCRFDESGLGVRLARNTAAGENDDA
jgi:hypothetical protein